MAAKTLELYRQNGQAFYLGDFAEEIFKTKPARDIDHFITMNLAKNITSKSFRSDSLFQYYLVNKMQYKERLANLIRKRSVSFYVYEKIIKENTIPMEKLEIEFKQYFESQPKEFKEKNGKKYATLFFKYADKMNKQKQIARRNELLDSLMIKYNAKILL
jgi:hypothetical protein